MPADATPPCHPECGPALFTGRQRQTSKGVGELVTVDLAGFVVTGEFGPLRARNPLAAVVAAVGEPDHIEPGRKARPTRVLCGDVEFTLVSDELVGVAVTLDADQPADVGPIPVSGLWPPEARTLESVGALLTGAGVTWRLDPVMSSIDEDESSQVWITDRHVHLGFYCGVLQRIAADYYMFP